MLNLSSKIFCQTTMKSILLGEAMPLGIPSWTLVEMTTRSDHPISPEDVLGLSKDPERAHEREICIVQEFKEKIGYTFPWGTVSEHFIPGEQDGEDYEAEPQLIFNFFLDQLQRKFPFSNEISEFFMSIYSVHRLAHSKFDYEDGEGMWDIFQLSAVGEDDVKELRRWLVKVFIPKIFPDLYFAAQRQFVSNGNYGGQDGQSWRPIKA